MLAICDAVMMLAGGQIQTYGPRDTVSQQLQSNRRGPAAEGERRIAQATAGNDELLVLNETQGHSGKSNTGARSRVSWRTSSASTPA